MNEKQEPLIIENPEEMNLLGLILANIIGKNLKKTSVKDLLSNTKSTIDIQAGKMGACIMINNGLLTIRRGLSGKADAWVKGGMSAFIDLGMRRRMLQRFLKGDVKIGGNIFKLLPLLRLLEI